MQDQAHYDELALRSEAQRLTDQAAKDRADKAKVENLQNSNLPVQPEPLEPSALPNSPQHIIRIKKLLQLRSPHDAYVQFMQQAPSKIAQDLMGVKLELSLGFWCELHATQPKFIEAICTTEALWEAARQQIILLVCQLKKLEASRFKFIDHMLHSGVPAPSDGAINLSPVINRVELLILNKTFLLSLPQKVRFHFIQLLLSLNIPEYENFLKAAHNNQLLIDFEDMEMNTLAKMCFNLVSPHRYSDAKVIGTYRESLFGDKLKLISGDIVDSGYLDCLSSAQASIGLITEKNVTDTGQLCLAASRCPFIATTLLERPQFNRYLTLKMINNLAAVNLQFAIKVIFLIQEGKQPTAISSKIYIYDIAHQNIPELLSGMPLSINNWGELPEAQRWCIARLIAEGLKGNLDLLFKMTLLFSTEDYFTQSMLNELLLHAYALGHRHAGMRLAENYLKGRGTLPCTEKALQIYQDIIANEPALLTVEAVDCLVQQHFQTAYEAYQEFTAIQEQLIDLTRMMDKSKPPTELITSLKSSFNPAHTGFFNYKPNVAQQLAQLEKVAEEKANAVIANFEPIISIPLENRADLCQHLGWQTAHMMMLRVLIEQKDMIADKSAWTSIVARSLQCAWNYDLLKGADDDLKSIITRIKLMKGQDIKTALNTLKFDKHLAEPPVNQPLKRTESTPAADEPKLRRSSSMPSLI